MKKLLLVLSGFLLLIHFSSQYSGVTAEDGLIMQSHTDSSSHSLNSHWSQEKFHIKAVEHCSWNQLKKVGEWGQVASIQMCSIYRKHISGEFLPLYD